MADSNDDNLKTSGEPLPREFFERSPELVAPDLLGCLLVSTAHGKIASGIIVETEAYLGSHDPGSHAATKGITARNATMYGPPGTTYVYFTYGNHYMLNLVCEPNGIAGAVLLRALEPVDGIDVMTARRKGRPLAELTNGPGKLAQALGIDSSDNGVALGSGRLQVYDGGHRAGGRVVRTGRVGLSAGHELLLRHHYENDPYVSRGRTGPPSAARRRTRTPGSGGSIE